jgi:osmoprotectant transport system substrate-binding protein
MNTVRTYRIVALGLLLALLLAACGGTGTGTGATSAPGGAVTPAPAATAETDATAAPAATSASEATSAPAAGGATGTIKLGSKDFTEAILVAEIYGQLLENAGFTVERKLNLGGTPVAHQALVNGDIDLYPEYTSTGLQEVLKTSELPKDPQEILATVKKGYEEQFKLTWLEPSPFNDSNVFATTQEIASQYSLKTFSDLVAKAPELRLGGPAEFPERQDTKGLEQAYGPFIGKFKEFKQLGTGSLRYDGLKNGEVDVIVAFGTDGRIKGDNLVVLQDDKGFYPIYNIAPVIRQDTQQKYPQIAEVLAQVAPKLTDEAMSGLNYAVDGPDKKEPADVAKEFLTQQGLLK